MEKIIFMGMVMLFCSMSWASDFSSFFEAALQRKLNISEEQIERGQRFSWVFVTGFFNEGAGWPVSWPMSWMMRYFGDHRDRLKNYVSGEEIYILRPSSVNSIETNAGLLLQKLHAIYEKDHKKMVIIAHSKGSPEILKMIANEPQETERMIEGVLSIQAAFGSQVADFVMWGKGDRKFLEYSPFGIEGLKSLTT